MARKSFSRIVGAFLALSLISLSSCREIVENPHDIDNPNGTDTTQTTDSTSNSNDTTATGKDTVTAGAKLPAGYDRFTNGVEVYEEGDYIIIKTKAIPDHGSPYFNQTDARYEAYNGNNPQFKLNPNRIREQNLTFRIPRNPVEDPNHRSTPMGPIGVSLNGVPFFNQYAAGGSPLAGEINSFDQYNGHPQNSGQYHYHVEPLHLTATLGKDALLGFLLDGFPVYGPQEKGKTVTDADLDDYHGHFGPTPEHPEGIYHYHITAEDPYLNGAGFFGLAGTVSQ